jgi:hypothetical protein
MHGQVLVLMRVICITHLMAVQAMQMAYQKRAAFSISGMILISFKENDY